MPSVIPYGNVNKFLVVNLTITPASVAATTVAEQSFTVPGVLPTDQIIDVTKPTFQTGLGTMPGRVSAANTVTIQFINPTASPIVPAAGVYQCTILRMDNNTGVGVVS